MSFQSPTHILGWFLKAPVMCRPRAGQPSCSERKFVMAVSCPIDSSLQPFLLSLALVFLSLPPLWCILSLTGRSVNRLFRVEHSNITYSEHHEQWLVSVVTVACKKKPLWLMERAVFVYGVNIRVEMIELDSTSYGICLKSLFFKYMKRFRISQF